MALSKEEESYKHFTSLRDKFSKPGTDTQRQDKPRSAVAGGRLRRANYDPRANAPPLLPLVEEGDQVQQELHSTSVDERLQKLSLGSKPPTSTPVKGKWKHSSHYKSNHLNGPDFDALETASVTSCSSAYSSRSESSTFSPYGQGSITELSDIGSCDTFLEYDLHSHKRKGVELPEDVPPELVQKSTKAWNRAIGDWVFREVTEQSTPSPTIMRKPSNEIRVPTPLTTPQGSTSNLLDFGSGTSLLSFASSDINGSKEEEDHAQYNPANHKLGRFIHPESNLITWDDESSTTEIAMTTKPKPEPKKRAAPPTNKWRQAMTKLNTLNKPSEPTSMRKLSNEIRIPILQGSTSNLLDSGSSDKDKEYQTQHNSTGPKPGRLVHPEPNLATPDENDSTTGITMATEPKPEPKKSVTPPTNTWRQAMTKLNTLNKPSEPTSMRKPSNEIRVPTPQGSTSNLLDSGSSHKDKEDQTQHNSTSPKPGRLVRPEPNLTTPDENDSTTKITTTTKPKPDPKKRVAPPTNKWRQAMMKFNTMNKLPECAESADSESEDSSVEKRAERFGGTRRGLRRAQSFQFGTRPPSQLTTHKLNSSSFI